MVNRFRIVSSAIVFFLSVAALSFSAVARTITVSARGELILRSSTVGTRKLSEGIMVTVVPEPGAGSR